MSVLMLATRHAPDGAALLFDRDGRLVVPSAALTRGGVVSHRGSELDPRGALGLDPGRVYRVRRDVAELSRAAHAFDRLPVLGRHTLDPLPGDVIGVVGSGSRLHGRHIRAPLVIWDRAAIREAERDVRRQLSTGFQFDAVAERGVYGGEPYEVRMTNIRPHHVALVREGRLGADCALVA